jgi:hypothetical protein
MNIKQSPQITAYSLLGSVHRLSLNSQSERSVHFRKLPGISFSITFQNEFWDMFPDFAVPNESMLFLWQTVSVTAESHHRVASNIKKCMYTSLNEVGIFIT